MINVLLAGVGGQGTVLAAKVLAQAATARGWQVRTAETIGMAQRGGNVTSHVRMGSGGEAVNAPLITPGTADMVIALEPGEAARALSYLAPGGVLVTATTAIQPVTAALSSQPYRANDVVEHLAAALASSAVRGNSAAQPASAAQGNPAATVVPTDGPTQGAPAATAVPNAATAQDDPAAPATAPTAAPAQGGPTAVHAQSTAALFVPVDDAALVRDLGPASRKSLNMMLLAAAIAQGRIPLTLDEVKQAVEACVKPQFVAMNLEAIDHAAKAYR